MKPPALPNAIALSLTLSLLLACGAPTPNADPAPPAQTDGSVAGGDSGFVVRFEAPHPLAEAQALEAAGHCAEAEELARRTIAAQSELSGLCFDRFTLGGMEIVLVACEPPADVESFEQSWLARLRSMDGVAYADPNAAAEAAACAS